MEKRSTDEARRQFADVINRAGDGKERVVLTRRGEALVAVVPIEDVRLLEEMEAGLELEEARAALAEVESVGTVPWARLKAELGLANG